MPFLILTFLKHGKDQYEELLPFVNFNMLARLLKQDEVFLIKVKFKWSLLLFL